MCAVAMAIQQVSRWASNLVEVLQPTSNILCILRRPGTESKSISFGAKQLHELQATTGQTLDPDKSNTRTRSSSQ